MKLLRRIQNEEAKAKLKRKQEKSNPPATPAMTDIPKHSGTAARFIFASIT